MAVSLPIVCRICERINEIKRGRNPYFVAELETGYVVIGDHQLFYGYTLFLSKEHKEELHLLNSSVRTQFLQEMSLVAEAVSAAFRPDKLNYELLGNTDRHLHWHILPRYTNDLAAGKPVWVLPKHERETKPINGHELELLKKQLSFALKK